jgi:hypothetical protein
MDSTSRFEPVSIARHRTELANGIEWTVVRTRKNWFALPFLCFWLTGWTLGGGAALYALITGDGGERLFLALWLVGWALGWIFAAASILWQIGGRTMVAITGGALVHAWSMPFVTREKRYDAKQIRYLRSGETSSLLGWGRSLRDVPPFMPSMASGSVKFDHGARTIQLFPGLDESEGRMIVDQLAARLPKSAVVIRSSRDGSG